jgi:hypothetical protein
MLFSLKKSNDNTTTTTTTTNTGNVKQEFRATGWMTGQISKYWRDLKEHSVQ